MERGRGKPQKKGINTMYIVTYKMNGFTITEKRNGLCYAKMLAERHNGTVTRDGVVIWEGK
jgi:hypothetical protein